MAPKNTFKSVLFGAWENWFFFFVLLFVTIAFIVTIFTYDYAMAWPAVFFGAIFTWFVRQIKLQTKDLNNGTSR